MAMARIDEADRSATATGDGGGVRGNGGCRRKNENDWERLDEVRRARVRRTMEPSASADAEALLLGPSRHVKVSAVAAG